MYRYMTMNHLRAHVVLLIVFLWAAGLDAATRIDGYFPEAAGQEIRLMAWDDLVSYRPVEVHSVVVGEEGHFRMHADVEEATLMFFRYRHGRSFFYLDPGQHYEIDFVVASREDSSEARSLHPMHQGLEVSIREPSGKQDINYWIDKMDNMVADHLEAHVMNRPRANHRPSLAEFGKVADSVFYDVHHPFVNAYKSYYLAYLESSLNTRSLHDLIQDHIHDKAVLYAHPMYMDFFSSLFDNYVFAGSRFITRQDLHDAVNRQACYYALMDTLAKDTILSDERLRELVMIQSLQAMLSISAYANDKVFEVLGYAARAGRYAEHRNMAANILHQQKKLKPGYPAPDVVLKDQDGNVVFDLAEKKGDYVYLFFWAGWCPVSMSEAGPMADIAMRYADRLAAVGIMVDATEHALPFAGHDGESAMPFSIYHYGGNYRLLDRFNIRSIPQYMLIDPDGHIVGYPFPAPSAGAGDRLRRIIQR